MTRTNTLKERLAAGGRAFGLWLHSTSEPVAEAAAAQGYDFMFVDNEHGGGGLADAVRLIRLLDALGVPPVVRVPWKDPVYLKRVLDAGATSIMVPTIETAEEAAAVVAACRYPPKGFRGFGPWRQIGLGGDLAAYARRAHEELLLIVQSETAKAVDNVAAIAAVDGVDALFIGPNDLSGSLGHFLEFEHPKVRGAIDRAFEAIRKAGKPAGNVPHGSRTTADLFAAGYAMVGASSDLSLVRDAAQAEIAAYRARFG